MACIHVDMLSFCCCSIMLCVNCRIVFARWIFISMLMYVLVLFYVFIVFSLHVYA